MSLRILGISSLGRRLIFDHWISHQVHRGPGVKREQGEENGQRLQQAIADQPGITALRKNWAELKEFLASTGRIKLVSGYGAGEALPGSESLNKNLPLRRRLESLVGGLSDSTAVGGSDLPVSLLAMA